MLAFLGVLLVTVLVVLGYGISIYNSLVSIKNNVSKAWANIDVLLKQRHDELPKLVETCKQYMKFEQDTLAKVMEARSRVFSAGESRNVQALGQAEGALRSAVGNLFAVAEAYPDLKTNQEFLNLQARITGLENAIADRRELYNESVNINNVAIEQFPNNVVAGMYGFTPAHLLQFDKAETADVDVGSLFKAS